MPNPPVPDPLPPRLAKRGKDESTLARGRFGYEGKITETVAVDEATTAYKLNGSLPVVGTSTGVFAAIGKPVVVVTPMWFPDRRWLTI